ncbi:hypothetical protein OLMES_2004 [Oleiphilus messinensis]|uniref:Uncharacterized protein n=1 Tax=Oleiphilus messinensis TaxID=141451 RepID=A0A1Y0I6F3_9GAMM|nr:hypothetical protein [Oleiphilus messinensis]ARU56078.1 hypothetical protein OLMES_2004 [Oleiphilus messinensis]
MRFATEYIVLHEDGKMPSEESFCPSIWAIDESDIDGDYYYDGIDGRWTSLTITLDDNKGKSSSLDVNTYREHNRNYEPSVCEADDLKRYIQYRKEGRFNANEKIKNIKKLCITSLCFESTDIGCYEEFLDTVYKFLKATEGCVVNFGELDADRFKEKYLSA